MSSKGNDAQHEHLGKVYLHLHPLKCSGEEELNEIPRKLDLNINRKREEIKHDELRTETNQGDKVKPCPKRTAAVEIRK